MSFVSILKLTTTLSLSLFMALLDISQAQEKLLLSEAIRKAIDTKGIDAAKQQFGELDQTEKDEYHTDMQGISELVSAYMKEGNMEAASAVSEIAAPFLQDMVSKSLDQYAPEWSESMEEERKLEKERQAKKQEEGRQRQQQETNVDFQGEPRNDLERFTGLYGDPEESNPNRNLWVTVSCDGYLVSGAMWGDAAPWWMKSESDRVFTYQDSFNKLRMEFETDANGKAVRMIHDLEFMKSPVERIGPLPEEWDPCLERPKR